MGLERRRGFVADHKQFGMHVRSEVARRPAMQVAKKIARRANALAPYAEKQEGHKDERHLRGSYTAKADGNLRIKGNSRAIARVESTVPEALFQEVGTKRGQRPRRILLRAAISVSIKEFGHFDGYGPDDMGGLG